MKIVYAVTFSALALSSLVGPASAGSSDWYIVLDTVANKCSVTDTKPSKATMKVLEDGKSYPSEEEGTAAMAKAAECKAK